MKPSHALAAGAVIVLVTNAGEQTPQPTVRKIATIGQGWISGIVETRNGRFIIYASGDSIDIRDHPTEALTRRCLQRGTDRLASGSSSRLRRQRCSVPIGSVGVNRTGSSLAGA